MQKQLLEDMQQNKHQNKSQHINKYAELKNIFRVNSLNVKGWGLGTRLVAHNTISGFIS